METPLTSNRSRTEALGVAVATLVGAALRLWPPGRFGLTHFDEGIYALAGSWSLLPSGIDPSVIPYSPPGFPILVGLSYLILGRSDFAAIAVSILAGIATIPVVAWLARRTFGAGAGFASAVFAALCGPHIAASRMALTDASFLLAWLLAIGAGMRFLERPNLLRAIVLGLTVGLAQEFKYNGWLTGGIVIGTVILGALTRPEDRRRGPLLRTFGWGLVAVGFAWLMVWPWFRFVEDHGGYSALLRHQRGYLTGIDRWWSNLQAQAHQAIALSGDGFLLVPTLLAGLASGLRPGGWGWSAPDTTPARRVVAILVVAAVSIYIADAPQKLGLMMAPWLLVGGRNTTRLVGVWWLALALLTPLYHPYARLWLPFHAANWLLLGWVVPNAFDTIRPWLHRPRRSSRERVVDCLASLYVVGALLTGVAVSRTTLGVEHGTLAGLLAPSDSLRRASSQALAGLPENIRELRLLARPPVTYYLAGRVAVFPMAGSGQLLDRRPPGAWALVDSAILRSESGRPSGGSAFELLGRYLDHWEVVEELPTSLSLPTLLDLDPGAARSASTDRSAPLWLLRPRRPGAPR